MRRILKRGLGLAALTCTMFSHHSCTITQDPYELLYEQENVTLSSSNGTAVIVVDMQDSFLDHLKRDEKKKEMPNYIEVLKHCKKHNVPVFVLEYKGHGQTTQELQYRILDLEQKVVITKTHMNGFIDTSLHEYLKKAKINTVYLVGVAASACVKSTAYGALERGINIIASKETMADGQHIEPHWNESIEWYKANGTYRDSYKEILKFLSENY